MGNIKEELDSIKLMLEGEKKKKEFKIPRKARVNKSKQKKNWVGVLKINENGTIEASKEQIIEQTVIVDGVPRLATPDYVLRWKKYPMIIQPSWSVKPFDPAANYNKSLEDGSNTKGYKILMNRMKLSAIEAKKINAGIIKWIVVAGLIGIVVYAILAG